LQADHLTLESLIAKLIRANLFALKKPGSDYAVTGRLRRNRHFLSVRYPKPAGARSSGFRFFFHKKAWRGGDHHNSVSLAQTSRGGTAVPPTLKTLDLRTSSATTASALVKKSKALHPFA
jgi:hypothetical protein